MRIFFFLVLLILSCNGQDDDNQICISLDQRQCSGDPWSEAVDSNEDANTQAAQLLEFLLGMGIEVNEIKVDPFFHQAVCEACFVCPDGTRIFLGIKEDQLSQIEALNSLNLEITDCSIF